MNWEWRWNRKAGVGAQGGLHTESFCQPALPGLSARCTVGLSLCPWRVEPSLHSFLLPQEILLICNLWNSRELMSLSSSSRTHCAGTTASFFCFLYLFSSNPFTSLSRVFISHSSPLSWNASLLLCSFLLTVVEQFCFLNCLNVAQPLCAPRSLREMCVPSSVSWVPVCFHFPSGFCAQHCL